MYNSLFTDSISVYNSLFTDSMKIVHYSATRGIIISESADPVAIILIFQIREAPTPLQEQK